jgi:hypothetical protein
MERIEMTADARGTLPTAEFCRGIDRVREGTAELVVHFTDFRQADRFYWKACDDFPEMNINWSHHTVCRSVSFQRAKHKVVSI